MGSDETVKALLAVAADYVEGMVLADEGRLRRAFHPQACSIGYFDGDTAWDGLDSFVAGCLASANPPADGKADWRVLSVNVTGEAAVMKLQDAGLRFTDTLTLMHHEGRWQIVSTLFRHDGERGRAPAA